jgi:hypothetical protein
LVSYVFERVPGISIALRNALNVFQSEEIDIALFNDRHRLGLAFLPHLILVECKNWSSPVTSQEVAAFDTKLRNRGLGFGILLAMRGITGDAAETTAAHQVVAGALREGRQIVVMTRDELEALTNTQLLVNLVKRKLCELAVAGILFPA